MAILEIEYAKLDIDDDEVSICIFVVCKSIGLRLYHSSIFINTDTYATDHCSSRVSGHSQTVPTNAISLGDDDATLDDLSSALQEHITDEVLRFQSEVITMLHNDSIPKENYMEYICSNII